MSPPRTVAALAASALACTLLFPTGVGATPASAAEFLTAIAEYRDGAVVKTVDLATGATTVHDMRGSARTNHAETGGGPGGAGATAMGDRCTNTSSHQWIRWGTSGRFPRPWRMPEDVRFDPDGAPVAFDWKAEVMAASDLWSTASNGCGLADTVGWVTPPLGPDNPAAVLPTWESCAVGRNNENNIGWSNVADDGLLAFVCVWSIGLSPGTWIHEGDMVFNANPAIPWCAGPCSGYDVRSVASHEWGHYLGLGHTCGDADLGACGAPEEAAVMYPFIGANDLKNRTLSAGDIRGAEQLYPDEFDYTITSITITNPLPAIKLAPGHEYSATVEVVNRGLRPWKVNDANFVLSTRDGGASPYAASDWVSPSAATTIDANPNDVGTADGRIPNDTVTVIRDESAHFALKLKIPYAIEGMTTTGQPFDVRADFGAGARFAGGPVVAHALDVGTFGSAFEAQTAVPVVVQGVETTEVWLDLENTGTVAWYPNETLTASPSDGAGGSRCSALMGSDWSGCRMASKVDQNLTETTFPLSPAVTPVRPGQVGRFKFRFASPIDPALLGVHAETFESRLDGGRFVGSPTAFTVAVV